MSLAGLIFAVSSLAACGDGTDTAGPTAAPSSGAHSAETGNSGSTSVGSSASCAMELTYAGHPYSAIGRLRWRLSTTGRTEEASDSPCSDVGGGAEDDEVATTVTIRELTALPLDRAFLASGILMVRGDLPTPDEVSAWMRRPACDSEDSFEVTGDWVGIHNSYAQRQDPGLPPPYRLDVWITDGPADLVGGNVLIQVTDDTAPRLTREDVRGSLWEGGTVTATVHCEDRSFIADEATSSA